MQPLAELTLKRSWHWDWATATIHLRSLAEEEATDRQVLCDTVVSTPDDEVDPTGLGTVWTDLVAVEG